MTKKIKFSILRFYFLFKGLLPWVQARRLFALNKYVETFMFQDRKRIMGEKFAIDEYIKRDRHFFLRRISFFEKLDILINPYSYIKLYRPKLQRYKIFIKQSLTL